MPSDRNSQRIVIAGASSLLGGELKTLVEESRFAGVGICSWWMRKTWPAR